MLFKCTVWSKDSWIKVWNLMPCVNTAKVHGSGSFFIAWRHPREEEMKKTNGRLVTDHLWRGFPFSPLSFLFIPHKNHYPLYFLTISSLTRMQLWNQTKVALGHPSSPTVHPQKQTLTKWYEQIKYFYYEIGFFT